MLQLLKTLHNQVLALVHVVFGPLQAGVPVFYDLVQPDLIILDELS